MHKTSPCTASTTLNKTGVTTLTAGGSNYVWTTDATNYTGSYSLPVTANTPDVVYIALEVEQTVVYQTRSGTMNDPVPAKQFATTQTLTPIRVGAGLTLPSVGNQVAVANKAFSVTLPEATGVTGTATYRTDGHVAGEPGVRRRLAGAVGHADGGGLGADPDVQGDRRHRQRRGGHDHLHADGGGGCDADSDARGPRSRALARRASC